MQIKLKELLENMTAGTGDGGAQATNEGVVEATVEDGPQVASACPPTPRKVSSIEAAIESLDDEALAQSEFFDPPSEEERVDPAESSRSVRRNTPPPPPPKREEAEAAAAPVEAAAPAPVEEEYESQTFSPGMLSPLSRRPPSGIIDPPMKPPKRDSGLIDVRSMAAAYREYDGLLKSKDKERGVDVETTPLPILGSSEHTSPIMLPQSSSSSRSNGWLYVLVAVLGAIVVIGSTVALTALVLKRRDGGGKSFAALSTDERAALCEAEAVRVREDEERIAAARRAPTAVPGGDPEVAEMTAADAPGTVPAPVPVASKSGSDDDGHHSRSSSRHGRDKDGEEDPSAGGSTSPAVSAPATPPPASTPSKPAATDDLAAAAGSATSSTASDGEKCDEVTCLVSGKGCCGKNPKGAGAKSEAPPPDPNLPARPERADISAGVASVQSRLQSCGDRHSVRGAVTVKISIAPAGEVKSASTTQGTSEFQSCIASALRAARFPASQQGARVSYPVMLK